MVKSMSQNLQDGTSILACSLERAEDGSMQVQKILCARVYHINVVLRIRTSVQDTRKDKAYKEKSLQIQR